MPSKIFVWSGEKHRIQKFKNHKDANKSLYIFYKVVNGTYIMRTENAKEFWFQIEQMGNSKIKIMRNDSKM